MQVSHIQCLTVYTGEEELVPMLITRACPAFMFSQYNMLVSLLMRMEKMMKMSTSYFCDIWNFIAFEGKADVPDLDSKKS